MVWFGFDFKIYSLVWIGLVLVEILQSGLDWFGLVWSGVVWFVWFSLVLSGFIIFDS